VKTHLTKPLLGVGRDTHIAETLRTGAVVEYLYRIGNGLVIVNCEGRPFSVLREDLLDACSIADAVEIDLLQEWVR
jgi:hypothetical protein